MIKVRADWHYKCTACGTELVVDFICEYGSSFVCPWCGAACDSAHNADEEQIKKYVSTAIKKIEQKVNCDVPVGT